MAIFWLALYVFVNLTSIIWLGSIAVNKVAGVDQNYALDRPRRVRPAYQLYGGLKAVALTDIVQVTLLVLGGLVVAFLTLARSATATALSPASIRSSRARPITST